MKNLQSQKIINLVLLLLVPVLYLYMGFFFHSERAYYYMYSVDPEYCYLFNGLNISQLTLKVWHVDHPGTPIQFLAAIVIRVVHLFHGNGTMLKDVMQNSDLYAYAVNVTMFSLTSIALVFLGRAAHKHTKSVIQSMFLQLTPFASYLVLTLVFRINPENMVIFCFILMGILILNFLQREKVSTKLVDKYLIGFAIVTGLTVAIKITFLPMFFIPFFLFKGLGRKIMYSIFSGFAFFIFIVPVLFYRFEYFYTWIKNLFIHSGKYGEGDANIIDKNAFSSALEQTFSFEYFFTVSFFVFVVACIIYHIPGIKSKIRNDKYYYVLLGITLCMLFTILLVAKQFVHHYLTLALLPVIFGLWIVVSIYLKNVKNLYKNIIFIIVILLFMSFDYMRLDEYHPINIKQKEAMMKTSDFLKENPSDKPLIIVPSYYGCPYQEYSLYFGIFWGGEIMKQRYTDVLNEIYPNTYFYNGWDEMFHNWQGDAISYFDLLEKHKSIRFFSGDTTVEKNVVTYITHNIRRVNDTEINTIFSNEEMGETLYEINYIQGDSTDTLVTLCNADSLCINGEKFIGTKDQFYNNGNTRSADFAYSGNYSSKVTKDSPYGMTYIIGQVKKDEHYKISVWRIAGSNDASLVVAGRNSEDLFISEKKSSVSLNGWEEIIIDFIVPKTMHAKELRIYAFNDSSTPAYFDDLTITAY